MPTRILTGVLLGVALLVVVVGLASIPAAASTAAQDTVYPIDDAHALTEPDAITTFDETGVASANFSSVDGSLTIAKNHEQADIPGYYTDFNKVYACLAYREGIERTLRVSIPSEYLRPRPGELESVTSSHTAHYARANDSTTLTVRYSSPGRACFAFTKAPGYYFDIRESVNRWVNDSTGIDLPSATANGDWQHVPESAFRNSTTSELDTQGQEMTVQFDADESRSTHWLQVPDCNDPAEQEICQYREDPYVGANASNASLVLMSTADTPPPVRYKYGSDSSEGIMAGVRDIQHAAERFVEDVADGLGGLFGGGD